MRSVSIRRYRNIPLCCDVIQTEWRPTDNLISFNVFDRAMGQLSVPICQDGRWVRDLCVEAECCCPRRSLLVVLVREGRIVKPVVSHTDNSVLCTWHNIICNHSYICTLCYCSCAGMDWIQMNISRKDVPAKSIPLHVACTLISLSHKALTNIYPKLFLGLLWARTWVWCNLGCTVLSGRESSDYERELVEGIVWGLIIP